MCAYIHLCVYAYTNIRVCVCIYVNIRIHVYSPCMYRRSQGAKCEFSPRLQRRPS